MPVMNTDVYTRSSQSIDLYSGQRARSQMELRKTHISNLPVEILMMIFISYYEITKAPILLLFVCREWHDVALSIPFLWTTIAFCPSLLHRPPSSIEFTMHQKITCASWKKLTMAARRAGQDMLTVFYKPDYSDLPDEPEDDVRSWLSSRCHILHVYVSLGHLGILTNFFNNLHNLKELHLDGSIPASHHGLDSFLIHLETSSVNLTNLKIRRNFFQYFASRQMLLARIRVFEVTVVFSSWLISTPATEAVFSYLKSLEVLVWPYSLPSGLNHIFKHLRTLAVEGCNGFPQGTQFLRLTTLNITCVGAVERLRRWNSGIITFPVLQNLRFFGYWENFALIEAPAIINLQLQFWDTPTRGEASPPTILRPESLSLRGCVLNDEIIELFDGAWKSVRQLEWTFTTGADIATAAQRLVDELSGNLPKQALCPQIESLALKFVGQGESESDMVSRIEEIMVRFSHQRKECIPSLHRVSWNWEVVERVGS